MTQSNQRLYDLVPAIYRIRDVEFARKEALLTPPELAELAALEVLPPPLSAEQEQRLTELLAKQDQGPLKSLLTVIAEQVAVLEENLEQLYDDQFVETCADWVVPYIGDLIGYRQPHGTVPGVASPRAEVANTIAYRRRKGTASVLEQLARDVTGWNARVVEFFQHLAGTQYMNHIRPHNQHTANLRDWEALERIGGAFDIMARTVDVRSPSTQAGRYNIPNIGIFLWRLEAYSLTKSPAPTLDGRRFLFSPLAHNMPLFTKPEAEKEITHLAEPINVPSPISRNTLDDYLDLYYGEHKSLYLWRDDTPVEKSVLKDCLEVCNLEDFAGGWAHLPETKIAIDPQLGRIALPPNWASANDCQAIHITGITGGSYVLIVDGQQTSHINYNASIIEISLALEELARIGAGNVLVTGNITDTEVDIKLEFVGTLSGTSVSPITVDTSGLTGAPNATVTQVQDPKPGSHIKVRFHYGFSGDMGGGEYERTASFGKPPSPIENVSGSASLQAALDAVQSGGTVEIEDSGSYSQALAINVDADANVVLRAANEHRATLALPGPVEINGGAQSTVTLNGLLITNGPLIVPATNNNLKHLIFRHCTLVPGLALNVNGEPKIPGMPSLIVHAPNVSVVIEHCIVGAIRVVDEAEITIRSSIVDANDATAVAYADTDDAGPGAPLEISNSTVIGKVHTHEMKLALNVVFKSKLAEVGETWVAPVISTRKQSGCVRFSYVPVGSRLPRRYRCQPDMAVSKAITKAKRANTQLTDVEKEAIATQTHARVKPVLTSRYFGTPGYGQLSMACPIEIRAGADDEAEMGAFHDLYQPQRETNLRLRFDEYLRFGLEAGIFYCN